MSEHGFAFAYGSLVSAASASETLGRPVSPRPATLRGWRRAWSLARDNAHSEKSFVRAGGGSIAWCMALDVVREPGSPGPNGALIELEAGDLERIAARELRYDRVEVGREIEVAGDHPPDGPVWVWSAKPENRREPPPPGAVVLASYLRAVESAYADLGPGELERFRETTPGPDCEVADAELAAGDRIRPGNPRAW